MKNASLLLLALLGMATAASAQQKIAPGLWEHSMTMQGAMGDAMAGMQQQLAAMPPEQRKQMEAMMAARGVALGGGAGAPLTVKHCVTPEQAARDEIPQRDGKCKQTSMQRSGNTLKFAFTCEGGTTGEGEYTLSSPKAHTGKMVVNTVRNGKTERVEMLQSGKWLGTDCGAVKPHP